MNVIYRDLECQIDFNLLLKYVAIKMNLVQCTSMLVYEFHELFKQL